MFQQWTYKLTGDKGTTIEVVAIMDTDTNYAVDVEFEVVACDCDHYTEQFYNEDEFIICRCIDGNAETGDKWATVWTEDGLTHADMLDDMFAYREETFYITKTVVYL